MIIAQIILSAIYTGNEPQQCGFALFGAFIHTGMFQNLCKNLSNFLLEDLGCVSLYSYKPKAAKI